MKSNLRRVMSFCIFLLTSDVRLGSRRNKKIEKTINEVRCTRIGSIAKFEIRRLSKLTEAEKGEYPLARFMGSDGPVALGFNRYMQKFMVGKRYACFGHPTAVFHPSTIK